MTDDLRALVLALDLKDAIYTSHLHYIGVDVCGVVVLTDASS